MSTLNPDISNGTCYYAYNQAAGSELVPSGNSYLAGCTDPEYTDTSCPWKSDDFSDQEWVGLIRCGAVDKSANKWAWAGCSVPSDAYTAPERLASCDCTSKSTLFVGEQALLRHASLPSSVGGSISWVSGYEVTAAADAATTGTSSPASTGTRVTAASSTGGSAAATATSTSAAASATGVSTGGGASLSVGAKAGIAVGSVGAVMSLVAVAVMVFLHRRRRKGRAGAYSPAAPGEPGQGQDQDQGQVAVEQAVDGSGGVPPPAYSGFKTELPADESVMPQGLQTPSLKPGPHSPGLNPGLSPEMAQSELGDRPMSTVSELSSNEGGGDRSRLGSPVYPTMVAIAELP